MSLPAFDFCWIPRGTVADTVGIARLGEELGYRTMWIPDQDFCHDPFVLAGAVAAATTRLGIGIGITTPLTRHPAHIARVAASLDDVSAGRLRLGLGSGNLANVVRPMGMPANGPADRVRSGIRAVTTLLAGGAVRFADGEGRVSLAVEARRRIPIYLGARGPRMMQLAGEVGDGVLAESLFNADGLRYAAEHLATGRARAGKPRSSGDVRSVPEVDGAVASAAIDLVAWQTIAVTDTPDADLDVYRPWVARMMQIGPAPALLRVGVDAGNLDRVVSLVNSGRSDAASAAVTDESVRCLILIGTPQQLTDRIREIRGRGATAVSLVSTASAEVTSRNLTRLAREVIPALT